MIRTDDPALDSATRDEEFEDWLKTRPVCDICGEPIQEEYAFMYSGGWICSRCIEQNTFYIDEEVI